MRTRLSGGVGGERRANRRPLSRWWSSPRAVFRAVRADPVRSAQEHVIRILPTERPSSVDLRFAGWSGISARQHAEGVSDCLRALANVPPTTVTEILSALVVRITLLRVMAKLIIVAARFSRAIERQADESDEAPVSRRPERVRRPAVLPVSGTRSGEDVCASETPCRRAVRRRAW